MKIISFLLLLFPLMLLAQTSEDVLTKQASVVRDMTDKEISRLEELQKIDQAQLEKYKKGLIKTGVKGVVTPKDSKQPYVFQSKAIKDKAIAESEEAIAAIAKILKPLKAKESFDYGWLILPPKTGDFGKLVYGSKVYVKQVLDEKRMLITLSYSIEGMKAVDNRAVPTSRSKSILVMVKNFPTKDLADGVGTEMPQVFEVKGTETYKTSTGSNTVFVIELLPIDKIEAKLKK